MRHGRPPEWLFTPARAVLDDLQGAHPIDGLQIVAATMDEQFNGLTLGLAEPSRISESLPQLSDELDPSQATAYGGGNWVPRSMGGAQLLVVVADVLQEDLAETVLGWGQSRPPCPQHPHPARAVVRDGEAWWVCERDDELLYRIGRGEVSKRPQSPATGRSSDGRRLRKRRHHGQTRKHRRAVR